MALGDADVLLIFHVPDVRILGQLWRGAHSEVPHGEVIAGADDVGPIDAVFVGGPVLGGMRVVAAHRGGADVAGYDGNGICYIEFGADLVAKIDVTFRSGQRPAGILEGPSVAYAADKSEFASSRIQRWFAREWSSF